MHMSQGNSYWQRLINIDYWCPKPNISHETESESETNEGFASETETEYFELKDSMPKPNPKPIRNLEKMLI